MKALHDKTQNRQGQSVAADLAARVAVIYEQYPMLCGFSVQERSTLSTDRAIVQLQDKLCLADVSVSAGAGFPVTSKICDEIACMLLDLMDEQPEAFGLLLGRTFARTLH